MKKDGLNWGISVAVNWIVIVAAVVAAYALNHVVAYMLAVLVVGTRQHALAVLGHDGAHRHVSENQRLNDGAASFFCFWPLGVGLHGWRKFHFHHHRTVGTPDDPELAVKHKYPKRWSPDTNPWRQFFLDLFGFSVLETTMLIRYAPPEKKIDAIGPLATIAGAWVAVLYWADWRALAIWHVASVTSFWAVFRLRAFTEHVGTDSTHRLTQPPLWKRLLYLPENTWLHWEHHLMPGVPARQLKEKARLGEI